MAYQPYNDFLGVGGSAPTQLAPQGVVDPNDQPNPANPGGVSNNELARRQAALSRTGGVGGGTSQSAGSVAGGIAAQPKPTTIGQPGTFVSRGLSTVGAIARSVPTVAGALNPAMVGVNALGGRVAGAVGDSMTKAASTPASTAPTRPVFGDVGAAPGPGQAVPGDRGYQAQGAAPAAATAAGAAPAAPAWTPAAADTASYDAGRAAIEQAQSVFQAELTRLSGVDPFGNQAVMQKATDRAVAQAAGTAAGARGGAQAQAGAIRQQQGVQSQLAARGIQDLAQQRTTDENNASQQRLAAAGGIMSGATAIAQNEGQKAQALLQASQQNLQAYLGGRELDQKETESLRSLSTEMAKIDQQRYATDAQYRASVNANLTEVYKADTSLQGLKYSVDAGENLSPDEWMMGLMGLGAGIAAAPVKSDRRSKYAVRAPRLAELKEFLSTAPGSHYRYRQPDAPGQRKGENYGPMAQNLAKSRIGRTVVVEKADGLYVDTGRLALAHHGALTHLADRLDRLAKRVSKKDK